MALRWLAGYVKLAGQWPACRSARRAIPSRGSRFPDHVPVAPFSGPNFPLSTTGTISAPRNRSRSLSVYNGGLNTN
jgi:hypothetical protein